MTEALQNAFRGMAAAILSKMGLLPAKLKKAKQKRA